MAWISDKRFLMSYLVNMDNCMEIWEQLRFIREVKEQYSSDTDILHLCEYLIKEIDKKKSKKGEQTNERD